MLTSNRHVIAWSKNHVFLNGNKEEKPKLVYYGEVSVKKIIEKKVNQEMLLYHSETGDISVLNATAEVIYSLYNQGRTVSQIANAIKNQFSIDKNHDLIEDVQKCIHELESKDLL